MYWLVLLVLVVFWHHTPSFVVSASVGEQISRRGPDEAINFADISVDLIFL